MKKQCSLLLVVLIIFINFYMLAVGGIVADEMWQYLASDDNTPVLNLLFESYTVPVILSLIISVFLIINLISKDKKK